MLFEKFKPKLPDHVPSSRLLAEPFDSSAVDAVRLNVPSGKFEGLFPDLVKSIVADWPSIKVPV